MMEESFWKTWLVVGALSLFGCSSLPYKPLTYEKAVNLAVTIYNSKAEEDCVYRLLEVLADPEWDPISESHQELNFTIKQTICLLKGIVFFDECDFREDGVIRLCTGYYFFDERPPMVVLTCVAVGGMEEEEEEEEEEEVEKKEEEKQEEKKEENQAKNKEEEELEKKKDEKEETDQPKRAKRFIRVFKKLKKGIRKSFEKKKIVTGHVTS